jgi:hypothetical protein
MRPRCAGAASVRTRGTDEGHQWVATRMNLYILMSDRRLMQMGAEEITPSECSGLPLGGWLEKLAMRPIRP